MDVNFFFVFMFNCTGMKSSETVQTFTYSRVHSFIINGPRLKQDSFVNQFTSPAFAASDVSAHSEPLRSQICWDRSAQCPFTQNLPICW